jgi:hypothetical protein
MLSNSTTTPTINRITNSTSTWSHPPPPMIYHSHPLSYEGNFSRNFPIKQLRNLIENL